MTITRTPNRLHREKSPYLLQHADNPVDWYPWGEEAFARARREDKPVFLSIGYSTCHWCHVMAHESFEDETVASLLNEAFVCIKVDREERPDIDGIYMSVCQMMTGSGGWPLTVVMMPDRRPFFAATYIPKESRWGRMGLVELIPRLKTIWETRRGEVEKAAAETTSLLKNLRTEQGELPAKEVTAEAYEELRQRFDDVYGGFGDAPKFPMPHQIIFLLRFGRRSGSPDAIEMAEKTLSAMRRGGICDQLGYGFHRYSTDRQWLVPHFEKMLYDQALLALAYTEAYQATGDETHGRTVREILTYCLRDLLSPKGGFYAAEDADSEGEEGRFYLWGMADIRSLLAPDAIRLAVAAFSLTDGGNFTDPVTGEEAGVNILHRPDSPAKLAEGLGMNEAEVMERLETVRCLLLAARENRVRPQRDDKILTDWNGLMIAALARAARVLDESRYLDAARATADFILRRLKTPEGRLLHSFCKGEAGVAGNLDDYAFLIWALIELYEAGFFAGDLREALALREIVDEHFSNPDGGYFSTPEDGEALLFRPKERHDGAVPSGNAVMMMNLIRLARMTGDHQREQSAADLGRAFAGALRRNPSAHAQWMIALELLLASSREVVIAGRPGGRDTAEMLAVLRRRHLPNLTLLLRPEGEDAPAIAEIAPFTREMRAVGGRAAAYVCTGFSCRRPVTDPQELAALLDTT